MAATNDRLSEMHQGRRDDLGWRLGFIISLAAIVAVLGLTLAAPGIVGGLGTALSVLLPILLVLYVIYMLESLVREQRRTNRLLEHLLSEQSQATSETRRSPL